MRADSLAEQDEWAILDTGNQETWLYFTCVYTITSAIAAISVTLEAETDACYFVRLISYPPV